jgi:hypothetical protein
MVDLEQMLDLTTPWCLRVAATLRIPGHIAAGHTGVADLAAATGCDTDALHAVLGHLVSQGVFTEESPGRFACNQAAEQLASLPFLDLPGTVARAGETVVGPALASCNPRPDSASGGTLAGKTPAHPVVTV